jgi:hypothetical protein
MRLTATVSVALAVSLCFAFGHASAQSCEDDGNKLLRSFADAKTALETKDCTELDRFISARTAFADFLDTALGNGCSDFYVTLNRFLVSATYKNPPADCGTEWKTKADNRQLQYDAIAVLNRDIRRDVFIDGDAIVLKQEFWHEGNHTVGLEIRKCRRKGADAAFAMQCAQGNETSESSVYSFDVTLIDTDIGVMKKPALTVQMGDRADTPEELVKSMTRKGKTSDATRILLQCLPNTQCVDTADGQLSMNLVQLYCDPRGQLRRCALAYHRRSRDDEARAALRTGEGHALRRFSRLAAHSVVVSGSGALRRTIAGAKGHLRRPVCG